MSKKLYVGSLPYSVDDTQLNELAKEFGEVISATVIMDKFSGRSKGFGFIEMANDDEALKAIEGLDGRDVGGRNLKVNEARPMTPRPAGGGGFGRRDSGGGGRRDDRGGGSRW